MAAQRKSLVTAVVWATAIAGPAGCAAGGEVKAKGSSEKKQAVAAPATKAPGDPFGGLTADQIADKAVASTKAARSVRMAGRVDSDGEQLTVDLAVDAKGSCTGRLGMQGGSAELRQVGKVMYLKGDDKFWEASLGAGSDSVTDLLKGRWIKVPPGSSDDMDDLCDLRAMIAEMDKNKAERQGMTKGPDAEVGGKPAATLVKKQPGGATITMYVAEEGPPYLLKVVKAGGDSPGTMVFTEHNRPVKAVAPPADEVVDLGNVGLESAAAAGAGAGG
ncbi:hypothetical protein SLUN_26270 [Streptomyces lunaelactis]|uniref:Lipoprotein n=1 Tax=Streptomyces lunaelactis TaxID=1535768 RepID=A0A2R4TEW1_9ACTN|nr:hypothetical protein [Streptomyces lunaelactis]AVZ77656.1 hypothetical protein SLUN_26270 [Streptomyces lunaelactis]NUK89707.1 hypothetical protein [Streptomyces lunaelactis]